MTILDYSISCITNTCSLAWTRLLLARIVGPHLGGDAVLYSVSTGMSVGILLSADLKTIMPVWDSVPQCWKECPNVGA